MARIPDARTPTPQNKEEWRIKTVGAEGTELITIVTPLSRPGSANTAASVCLDSVYRKQERSLFTAVLEQTSNMPTAIVQPRPTAGLWSPIPSIRSAIVSLRRAARLLFDRCATAPETRPLPAVSRAHPPREVIFRYRLWRSSRQRKHALRCGIPSCDYTSAGNPTGCSSAVFACLKIRSLLNKFDDVNELIRDRRIDLLCITESWHDADSAILGRFRSAGYNVVDRPRPRAATDDLSVNHGGVVVIAGADVALSAIIIDGVQPTSFESLCVHVAVGRFTAIVVVLYRPGSAAVQQKFFDELSTILD